MKQFIKKYETEIGLISIILGAIDLFFLVIIAHAKDLFKVTPENSDFIFGFSIIFMVLSFFFPFVIQEINNK